MEGGKFSVSGQSRSIIKVTCSFPTSLLGWVRGERERKENGTGFGPTHCWPSEFIPGLRNAALEREMVPHP